MTVPSIVPAPPTPPYASYIEGREHDVFKPHKTMADLKNAIHVRTEWDKAIGKFVFTEDIGVYTLRGNDYEVWLTLGKSSSPTDYPVLFR